MIWIFDLDETLYSETDFVVGALLETAKTISGKFEHPSVQLFEFMNEEFQRNGRLRVFQELLASHPDIKLSKDDLIEIYRKSKPQISLFKDAERLLKRLGHNQAYLVTDGDKNVQKNKIEALGINNFFKEIFVTDEHGLGAPKPGTKCFEMIKKDAKCGWNEMVYIADDPHKDFINLKPLGMRTVRVNRGRFKDIFLSGPYEAEFTFETLDEINLEIFES